MFNNDEDDDTPVAVDPELDTEIADAEGADEDDEADVAAAARKPKRAGAKAKKAADKAAAKAKARKPARSVTKAAPAKAASEPAKKPAKAAKAKKRPVKKAAKATAPPADLTGVKAGAHTLWVSKDLAGALTSKDRRRLKALLKRAEKRRKAQKK